MSDFAGFDRGEHWNCPRCGTIHKPGDCDAPAPSQAELTAMLQENHRLLGIEFEAATYGEQAEAAQAVTAALGNAAADDPALSLFSDADLVSLALDVIWALGQRRHVGYATIAMTFGNLVSDEELRRAIEGRR